MVIMCTPHVYHMGDVIRTAAHLLHVMSCHVHSCISHSAHAPTHDLHLSIATPAHPHPHTHTHTHHIMSTDRYYSHTEPLLDVTHTYDTRITSTDALVGEPDDDMEKRLCPCCTRRKMICAAVCATLCVITSIILFCVTWWVIVPYVTQKQVRHDVCAHVQFVCTHVMHLACSTVHANVSVCPACGCVDVSMHMCMCRRVACSWTCMYVYALVANRSIKPVSHSIVWHSPVSRCHVMS